MSGAVVVGMVSGPVRRAVGAQRPPAPPPCGHGPDTSLPTLPGPWEMRVRTRKRLNLPQQQPRLAGLGAQSRGRPPTAGCGTPGCWTWTSLLIVEVRDCSVIVHVKSTRRFSHEQEPGVRTTRLIPVLPMDSRGTAPRLESSSRALSHLTPRRSGLFSPLLLQGRPSLGDLAPARTALRRQ